MNKITENIILITGGAGYIGSHTALNFLEAGFDVIVLDNLENGHIETINKLKEVGSFIFIQGNIQDKKLLDELFKKYKIDTVINFAGYIQVEESVKNPAKYYENNVNGTLNLLDMMVKHKVTRFVFSSSAAVYGEPHYTPIDENHIKQPLNAYGKTKSIIEDVLEDYDKAYSLKSICLRYFNVAGADSKTRIGEWHEPETHLIPNILKSIFEVEKTFEIFGTDYDTPDGTCIRDYVNVEDLADAHRLAYLYLKEKNISDCFNLGTEFGSSVKEVFSSVEKITGKKINVEILDRRAGDAAILLANSKKAKEILKWQPKRTLEDSIKTAFLWEQKKNNTR